MNILFHTNRYFNHFTDVFEYATLLNKQQNINIYYIGFWERYEKRKEEDIVIYHIPYSWKFPSYRASKFIKQICINEKIDIVHVFHYRGCFILPSKRKLVKWILDIRTLHVSSKNHKATTKYEGYIKDRITWFESLLYDHKIALTEKIKKKLKPSIGKIIQIPLGVSKDKYHYPNNLILRSDFREKYNIPNDAIVLVYAGSLSPARGTDIMLRSCNEVLVECPNVFLIIAGNELNYLPNYDPRNSFSKSFRRVLFLGQIPYNSIPELYNACDIGLSFVLNSTQYAWQPVTKIFEYMMAGLIVVSNRTFENDKVLKDSYNAFCSSDEIDTYVYAIKRAIENVDNRSIKDRGRKTAIDYTWDSIISNQLYPFYKSLFH